MKEGYSRELVTRHLEILSKLSDEDIDLLLNQEEDEAMASPTDNNGSEAAEDPSEDESCLAAKLRATVRGRPSRGQPLRLRYFFPELNHPDRK